MLEDIKKTLWAAANRLRANTASAKLKGIQGFVEIQHPCCQYH
jgi:hypothetical protein